jgi:hypothetical protein
MDFRTNKTRQALAMLGACFGLLLLASPANARPDGFQPQLKSEESSDAFSRYLANHRAHEEQAAVTEQTTVIPYLSHGEGVIVGDDGVPESQPTVIPYLSHGIGVNADGSTATLREQPDGFQPQLHSVDSTPVADDGFDWETTGYVSGGILAAMLLALMSTIALRDRRGLRSA